MEGGAARRLLRTVLAHVKRAATWSTSTRARCLRWGLTWIVWKSAVRRRLCWKMSREVRRLVEAQYDVARNGTLVYLSGKSSAASWPVAWMDSTGKTTTLAGRAGPLFHAALLARWHSGWRCPWDLPEPAGMIQVYDWQRDTTTRLTFAQTKGSNKRLPVWTPDGKHIAFGSRSPGANSLRWIRADGAGEAQPLLESKDELRPYSFSPDGKRLAFAELERGSSRTISGRCPWT